MSCQPLHDPCEAADQRSALGRDHALKLYSGFKQHRGRHKRVALPSSRAQNCLVSLSDWRIAIAKERVALVRSPSRSSFSVRPATAVASANDGGGSMDDVEFCLTTIRAPAQAGNETMPISLMKDRCSRKQSRAIAK